MSTTTALSLAAALTLALAAVHLAAPHLRRLPGLPERATGSFAGGTAVAYVFLHLLPELSAGNEQLTGDLTLHPAFSPLLELAVFGVALAGFLVFYAVERVAERHAAHTRRGRSVLWAHVALFAAYNAVITYTLPLRLRSGLAFGLLFAVAIGLHFLLIDRGLEDRYGARFGRGPRLTLAGALLAGWLLAAAAAPTSRTVVALLTAALAGSLLLNVFKEEVPSAGRSSIGWFTVGAGLYATLLLAVTLVES